MNTLVNDGKFLTVAATPTLASLKAAFQDISHISEYGLTQKLSSAIRCF